MEQKWWKEAVVYEIYVSSFNDSNGDGIGDIPGIIEKLDYIKDLGVDVIWLSPIYESPGADNGYDISNYYRINEVFGSLSDLDRLIEAAHSRGIKIVMDLVVNHTSDEHPWFIESRSSADNKYRDYYIWKEGKKGGPPNNWGSWFGGSAWEYDEKTQEYYLHIFSKKQPDLNWKNSKLREEIYEMMKWWLDKGIDGFRMDVINLISKDLNFPDGEKEGDSLYGDGSPYYVNGPDIHKYLQEMNQRVLSDHQIVTVGETPGVTPEIARKYVNCDRNELNMVLQFEIMEIDNGDSKWEIEEWKLTDLKSLVKKWYKALKEKGWNSWYLNNHDRPRAVSRFGNDGKYRVESAKMLATFLLTLPGTPFIYQGEEIGMTNVEFEDIDNYRDIETLNYYKEQKKAGIDTKKVMESIHRVSRDNARTPMQWSGKPGGGFTDGNPWIKLNPNHKIINVAKSKANPDSIYSYYRKLIKIRKQDKNLALIYGDYQTVNFSDEQVYAYLREMKNNVFLIVLNFTGREIDFDYDLDYRIEELILSNYSVDFNKQKAKLNLQPYEARIYRLK